MLHYRMNKIIKLLECYDFPSLRHLYGKSKKYRKAFFTLGEQDVIDFVYIEEENRLTNCALNSGKAAIYALSREEVWWNRFWAFVVGVVTGFVFPFLIR